MKKLIAVVALVLGARVSSPALVAEERAGEDTRAPKASKTGSLVAAAKEAKTKRKQSSTKVITNADVKKSKGKLIVLPGKADDTPPPQEPTLSPFARQDLDYRERLELEKKMAAATAKVTRLQKELAAIESRYYEENDPDRRDTVIRQQFIETKKELEAARAELAAVNPESQEPRAESPR